MFVTEGCGMHFFEHVELVPPDPILGLQVAYNQDPRTTKVNLSVGVYKTPDLKTPILKTVKKAEALILENEKSKEYLPIDGDSSFTERSGQLIFGRGFWVKNNHRIHAFQSVGGTGALRIGADFLKQEIGSPIFISDPTWPNHRGVFTKAGLHVNTYPYYDIKKQHLEFDRFYECLSSMHPKSIAVFHACCHNPTGADLSLEQWQQVSSLCLEKGIIPFFDCAYQGFGKGVVEDVQPIRLFAEEGHEMLVASSYSKNFGLYAERIGALFVVAGSEKSAKHIGSKIKIIVRTNFSNPPLHGARIIAQILGHDHLKAEWETELAGMRERILEMRQAFTAAIMAKCKKKDFRYLNHRFGLFSFCGLEKMQVDRLISEYGIYMTGDGRINVAGLNEENMDYVVNSIAAVI